MMLWTITTCVLAGGPVPVTIEPAGPGYRLVRGGAPYYIKGAVYWTEPDGRFPLRELRERGANSVRVGGRNVQAVLDACAALGLTATVGLELKKESVDGFDYGDPAAVTAQFERLREQVARYKDHPALLAWGVGNELSHNYHDRRVWDAVEQLAAHIHQVDPHHPTMTVLGDGHRVQVIRDLIPRCPSIDLLGINHYGGIEQVPGQLAEAGWTKPWLVTEWGPTGHWQVKKTAWKAPIEETSSEKARVYRSRYEQAIRPQPACVGSYVFMWDERMETTPTWYGMFLRTGERTEAVNVMTELWGAPLTTPHAPELEPLLLDGRRATESVRLRPGQAATATLTLAGTGELRVTAEVAPEVTRLGYAGRGEQRPVPIEGAVTSASVERVNLTAPTEPGPYRLYVTVRDGFGNGAVANFPFWVE